VFFAVGKKSIENGSRHDKNTPRQIHYSLPVEAKLLGILPQIQLLFLWSRQVCRVSASSHMGASVTTTTTTSKMVKGVGAHLARSTGVWSTPSLCAAATSKFLSLTVASAGARVSFSISNCGRDIMVPPVVLTRWQT
jgi:hypothetical protein